jgi:hypothetical protein
VLSRVGGVEVSDIPDESAVDGRPSILSFRDDDFLRVGTPSGHVHWTGVSFFFGRLQDGAHVSLPMSASHAIGFGLITLSRVMNNMLE